MTRCFLALGGNTGPVNQTFDGALERLDAEPRVTIGPASRRYRTQAVGEEAGGEFLNAAVEITTDLPPLHLLDLMQSIENRFDRHRSLRWGPRTLDLDLILYGDRQIELPGLQVPHPACWYRRFVLDPLCEIAGDVVHPQKGLTIAALRRRLLDRPLRVCLVGGESAMRNRLTESLGQRFERVEWSQQGTTERIAPPEPALLVWLGPSDATSRSAAQFKTLPRVPRLDASAIAEGERETFLGHVLQSATLQPRLSIDD